MSQHLYSAVDPSAQIDPTAEIGPYCIVGPDVVIGPGTRLLSQVVVEGPTKIGADNVFHPFSTVGVAAQDLKYKGERSRLEIGDRNQIREFVSIHRGTEGGGLVTNIGSDNLIQAQSHIAHDCRVGSHTILAHGATLGGHVTVDDHAVVGAWSGVHQFCRIGAHCYIGGYSVVTQDVMPYSVVVTARESETFGVNKIGLGRRGFESDEIQSLHTAVRILTKSGLNVDHALERIGAEVDQTEHVARLIEFIRSSKRGIVR